MPGWSYGLLALAAGFGIPVMARLHATLGQAVGSAAWAAWLLFLVAMCSVAIVLIVTGEPVARGWSSAMPWSYVGGALVAFYLLTVTFLIPRFGVGPTIIAVVTGQIVAAAMIDHYGWLGGAVRPLGSLRAGGLAAILAGLVMFMQPQST